MPVDLFSDEMGRKKLLSLVENIKLCRKNHQNCIDNMYGKIVTTHIEEMTRRVPITQG